jgi:hypothetical protein
MPNHCSIPCSIQSQYKFMWTGFRCPSGIADRGMGLKFAPHIHQQHKYSDCIYSRRAILAALSKLWVVLQQPWNRKSKHKNIIMTGPKRDPSRPPCDYGRSNTKAMAGHVRPVRGPVIVPEGAGSAAASSGVGFLRRIGG